MDREEAKEYIKTNPEIYFKPARKSGYICPICQNGTGKDGTGITEIKGKEGLYKCFKCDFSGDVFDFIAEENKLDIKSDFSKVMDIARNIYGVSEDNSNLKKKREHNMNPSINKQSDKPSGTALELASTPADTDYTDFFEEAAKHMHETDYLTKRGISEELQKEFKIGYCKEWKHPKNLQMLPSERIIIPTSKHSYIARAVNGRDEQYKVIKVGKTHLFNLEALYAKSEPVFITEGEIDALSILEIGGQAVGLGGVTNIGLLELEVNKERPTQPLILCLDNDDVGKAASDKIEPFLKTQGVLFENKSKHILGEVKDPNELLVKDREKLKDVITEIKNSASDILDTQAKEYETEYENKICNVLEYFNKEREAIKTGFENLDKFLDGGLFTGLYILGAASGAGKTTFILQIADYIAENGKDVLFFSGEMTMSEILSKSISRESVCKDYDKDITGITAREVMNSVKKIIPYREKKEIFNKAIKRYEEKIYKAIRIIDGRQNIETIETEIGKYQRIKGKSPVVFIDYLQALRFNVGKDLRQQIDETISNLRILAAKNDTPILIISSLNRDAYRKNKNESEPPTADEKNIGFASFKESGAIEYGADVLMTLQAQKNSDNRENKRTLELRVLKQRLGKTHRVGGEALCFDFYYYYNLFQPIEAKIERIENKRNEPKIVFRGGKVL